MLRGHLRIRSAHVGQQMLTFIGHARAWFKHTVGLWYSTRNLLIIWRHEFTIEAMQAYQHILYISSVSRNGVYMRIQNLWPHACCISSNHTPNHVRESYPRIILRIIPMILKPCFETSVFFNWIGKSWWSSRVAVKSCVQFLRQTMSPEWLSTQDVHFLNVFDTAPFLFFQKQLHARIIPRIIPDTYPESYLNLALLCHDQVGPFKNNLWELLRRRSKGIFCVDSQQARANHTPNHTSETYLETYPPMQHALLTPVF